jgi:hypothetical protein
MSEKISLVVTSIAPPQSILKALARGSAENNYHFIVIGDTTSPEKFQLDSCDFYSLEQQNDLPFKFSKACPLRHYSRKNIGYLIAAANGSDIIIETDDDNLPGTDFWNKRVRKQEVDYISEKGWVNVYRFFSDSRIWPRGYPLELLQNSAAEITANKGIVDCPVQQGLANGNPDVDAVYRLTLPLPQNFKTGRIALGNQTWCPFNSQNTTFFKEAFPLLYLPSFCSFRMTDIWRSFIAQRIAWTNNWYILFHEPTVHQERNEHNLMKDFADEIPGYLNNFKICEALSGLDLKSGTDNIPDNMVRCYDKLINMELIDKAELKLLDNWLEDLNNIKEHL